MDLNEWLAASRATPAFAADVQAYVDYQTAPRVITLRAAPRIKVLRVITQLVAVRPEMVIDGVRIDGVSGCADFRGTVTAVTLEGSRAFGFVWDCSWRAQVEGWIDARGTPDQVRAAREFGWRCFESWVEYGAPSEGPSEGPSDGENGGQLVSAQPGA